MVLLDTISGDGFSLIAKGPINNVFILADLRSDSEVHDNEAKLAERRNLESLLFDMQTFECSDARDKVFALLGLASDFEDCDLLRPDYEKSADKVFEGVARYIFCNVARQV